MESDSRPQAVTHVMVPEDTFRQYVRANAVPEWDSDPAAMIDRVNGLDELIASGKVIAHLDALREEVVAWLDRRYPAYPTRR